MYELETEDGIEQFSMQELNDIAAKNGYSLDVLLEKNPNLKKVKEESEDDTEGKELSQGQGAPVAETAAPEIQLTDTGSSLADGFSELQEISLEEKKKLPYAIRQQLTREQDFSSKRVNELLRGISQEGFNNIKSELKNVSLKDEELEAIEKEANTDVPIVELEYNGGMGNMYPAEKTVGYKKPYQDIIDKEKVPEGQAKEIFIRRKKKELFELKYEEKLEEIDNKYNLNDTIRKELSDSFTKEQADKNADYINQIGRLNVKKQVVQNYVTQLETAQKEKINLSPKVYDEYLAAVDSYNDDLKKVQSIDLEAENLPQLADLTRRSYNNMDVALDRVKSTVLNFGSGLAKVAAEANIAEILKKQGIDVYNPEDLKIFPEVVQQVLLINKDVANQFNKTSKDLSEYSKNINEYAKKRQELKEIKSPEDFLEFSLDLFSEQAVNTAITATTGGVGLVGISAAAAGNKWTEMDTELELAKKEGKKLNYSPFQYYATGALYGFGEYITEKVALNQFLGAKKAVKKAFDLDGLTDYSLESLTKGQKLYKAAKQWGIKTNEEGTAELGSQLIQNFADKFILDKKIALTENLDVAYVSGAVMSGLGFNAPVLTTDIYRAFSTDSDISKVRDNARKLAAVGKELKKLEKQDLSDPNVQQAIKLAQESADALIKENINLKGINEKRMDDLSTGDKRSILNIFNEQFQIKNQIDAINNNDQLSNEIKQEKILSLTKRIDDLNARRNSVLNSATVKNDYGKQSKIIAENDLDVNVVEGNNNIDAAEKAKKIISESNLAQEAKTKLTQKVDNVLQNEGASAHGFTLGAEFGLPMHFVLKENAVDGDTGNATVVSHELGHMTLFKYLAQENGDVIGLVNDLEKYLRKNYKNINEVLDNVAATYEGKSDFDIAEEKLAALTDYVRQRNIKTDLNFQGKLFDKFNSVFNKEAGLIKQIKNGKDVFNLLLDYTDSFEKGELSDSAKNIRDRKIEVKKIDSDIESKKSDKSFSLAEDASKKVQDIYDTQGIAGVYEIMDEYKPMANKIAQRYRDRPGFTTYKEDLVTGILDDPTYGVMGLVLKYKPEENKGVPLAAYINKYLAARSITLANQLLGKDEASTFKSDVTEVKDVMATETAEDAVVASEEISKEKPAKKKTIFSDEIKFDEQLSVEFDKTLIKAISLNIKKFDIETGKNRTVTPFVADLKKDIADFAEKDIVKFIKRQGLESFLIKNRELILNNYTTTFLSKHPFFRKGILKQVNGEWVAPTRISAYKYDWVDANGNKLKIDRDNAAGRGMTSGPEIMKRNPRITDVIKENEFVDYHFQDGALRKKAKQNPVNSLGRQLASEVGFEMIEKDIDENGKLTETIVERADLLLALSAEKIAEKVGSLKTDFGRGNVKFSKKAENYIKNNPAQISTYNEPLIKYLSNAIFTRQPRTKSIWENAFEGVIVDDKFKNATIEVAEEFIKLINSNITKEYTPNIKDIQAFLNAKLMSGSINELAFTSMFGLAENSLNQSNQATVDSAYISLMQFADEYVEDIIKEKGKATKSDYVDGILESIQILGKGYANGKSSYLKRTKNLYDILENYLENTTGLKPSDFNIKYENNYIFKDGEKVFITDAAYGPWQSASDISVNLNTIDISKLEMSKRNDQFNRNTKRLDKIIKYAKRGIEKGNLNAFDVAVIMNSQTKHMATPLKMSYELKYFTYVKGETGKEFVYEHIIPVNILAKAIAGNIVGIPGFSDQLIKKIRETAFASITQKDFDDILTKNKLQSNMPLDFIFGSSDALLRYFNEITKTKAPGLIVQDLKSSKIITHENFSQETKTNFSKSMNTMFNEMIERKKGILATETISKATAKLEGAKKGKYKLFIPPSADDLVGMLYNFLGTGKQGDADMAFFEEKLLKPLARANHNLNAERQLIKTSYHNLIKNNKGINKKLRAESEYKYYDNDAAVRVYMWTRLGYDIPGINAKDKKALINAVVKDAELLKFAEELINVPNKKESWLEPAEDWTASTIEMDLQEILSKIGRARIFSEYIENANIIFSDDNLNKIEAAYGPDLASSLKDMLYRIEKGQARELGANKLANAYLNWVRGSVATTMFFNMRSAALQQLSIVNFTNWSDNNPLAQGKLILTKPKEYAKYWTTIFNSDWMKERREGLKTDINESELAARLEGSKNKRKALHAFMLEKGFALTKYGDNFAIATGGAPFLYNREQTYIKQGMSEADAKKEAFLDFQELAEQTQQSSRQDLLSNQQVSVIGRIFLAFQNTPMQMTRLTKKAALDLINNRGSRIANMSRIAYYSAIQNMVFSFYQNALFALIGIDDDDEDNERMINTKTERAINNVLDGVLRGSGIAGATVATLKNAIIKWKTEDEKGWGGKNAKVLLELLNVSPAVGIKARKVYGAMESYKFNKKILDKIGYDNPNHPYYGIAGNLTSAAFNVPLDRIITKASNIKAMSDAETETWQKTALFLGYNTWDLGLEDKEIKSARVRSKFKPKIIKTKRSNRRSNRRSSRKSNR